MTGRAASVCSDPWTATVDHRSGDAIELDRRAKHASASIRRIDGRQPIGGAARTALRRLAWWGRLAQAYGRVIQEPKMPEAMDVIDLRVNGRRVGVAVDPDTPLIHVLRNDLGLKGTRMGCGEGQCMSCTVLVDGLPRTSCTISAGSVAGREIETVESLVEGRSGHLLVDCFLKQQAGQCGYCLAGILMRAKALLGQVAKPTREEIAAALDGHLCRCGAHSRIIRAIEQAALASGSAP